MLIVVTLTGMVLLLAVLAGGILPGTLSGIAIAACAVLLIGAARAVGAGRGRPAAAGHASGLLAGCLIAFIAVTAVPLPRSLEFCAGAERCSQNEIARAAIGRAAELGLAEKVNPVFCASRNRAGTLRMALLLIAGFAAAGLASRLAPRQKAAYLKALVALGVLIAGAGFISQRVFPQGRHIWWMLPVTQGHPVGCFICRNHFGGFVAMLCPACVALLVDALSRRARCAAIAWSLAFCVMSVAVVMSLSTGAWIAYAASAVGLMVFAVWRHRWIAAIVVAGLVGLAIWAASSIPNEGLEEEFESTRDLSATASAAMRIGTWKDAIRIAGDYPVLGAGMNAFRMVFPQHRTASTRKSFKNAENEYLQWLVEGGLLGSVLAACLVCSLLRGWLRTFQGGLTDGLVHIAAGGAAVVVAVHSLFDFPLRVPVYFVVFCSLVGLAALPPQGGPAGAGRGISAGRIAARFMPAFGLVLALFIAAAGRKPYDYDSTDFMVRADPGSLCRVLTYCPTSWQAWYHLGRRSLEKGGDPADSFGELCISRAAGYDSNNYRVWLELCRIRLSRGDVAGARAAYARVKNLRSWVRIAEFE